jgi:hypothetical protein
LCGCFVLFYFLLCNWLLVCCADSCVGACAFRCNESR